MFANVPVVWNRGKRTAGLEVMSSTMLKICETGIRSPFHQTFKKKVYRAS